MTRTGINLRSNRSRRHGPVDVEEDSAIAHGRNTHDKSGALYGCDHDVLVLAPAHPGLSRSQEAIAKISKARTVVRQMRTLGKAKKLAKAEKRLAKLKEKEVRRRITVEMVRGRKCDPDIPLRQSFLSPDHHWSTREKFRKGRGLRPGHGAHP